MSDQVKNEYIEVDKNMLIQTSIDRPDIKFYDVRKPPFDVYGFYEYRTEPYFPRMPTEVGEATSAGVARLEKECAGGRVRFCTDSSYVAINVEYELVGRNSHTPLEASAGFDLYEDFPGGLGRSRFLKAFQPPYGTDKHYEQDLGLGSNRMRYFTLNFPLHSVVKNVDIGIQGDATIGEGMKYRNRRPVVVYGSSIVHGTGPTRPGLTYTNMLCRRLDLDVVNLGFSGNAKGEQAIVDWMAEQTMSIFVCDYDHNATSVEYLQNTHQPMYDSFRKKQPDTPYVVISRPDGEGAGSMAARRDVIIDTFRHARSLGDKNIYYIDGESFFLGRDENDCTIDNCHPNDYGNLLMADAVECTLRKILESRDCLN